jgi:plasmid maintenance system antidote protein VapI
MSVFTKEMNDIVNEYRDIHDSLNKLQEDIEKKMDIHVNLNNKLDMLREREKIIINNIENDTGEKLTPSYLYNIMLKEQCKL